MIFAIFKHYCRTNGQSCLRHSITGQHLLSVYTFPNSHFDSRVQQRLALGTRQQQSNRETSHGRSHLVHPKTAKAIRLGQLP